MSLPPFGSVKQCCKCGERYQGDAKHPSSEPGMEYHRLGESACPDRLGIPDNLKVPTVEIGAKGGIVAPMEHICRHCLQCGYTWPEAIWVDSEPRLPE